MIRLTKQRRLIREILLNRRDHPSADEIFVEAKKHLPYISLSTVYRTLKQMVEDGELQELKLEGEGKTRYDINDDGHAHFVCKVCSKIYDVKVFFPIKLIGFRVEKYSITMYGVCKECSKEVGS